MICKGKKLATAGLQVLINTVRPRSQSWRLFWEAKIWFGKCLKHFNPNAMQQLVTMKEAKARYLILSNSASHFTITLCFFGSRIMSLAMWRNSMFDCLRPRCNSLAANSQPANVWKDVAATTTRKTYNDKNRENKNYRYRNLCFYFYYYINA